MPWVLGGMIGAGLAGGGTWAWFALGPAQERVAAERKTHQEELKRLQVDIETARIEASNLRTGNRTLTQMLNAFNADWNQPPAKPRYERVPDGIILFWEGDLIWRRYLVYQSRGAKGAWMRATPRPLSRGYWHLKDPAPGTWRFAVSALNKEGRETARSDALVLSFPLD